MNENNLNKKVLKVIEELRKELRDKIVTNPVNSKLEIDISEITEQLCYAILKSSSLNDLLRTELKICSYKFATVLSIWNYVEGKWFIFKEERIPHHIEPPDDFVDKGFNVAAKKMIKENLTLNSWLKHLYINRHCKLYGYIEYEEEFEDDCIVGINVTDSKEKIKDKPIKIEEQIQEYRQYFEITKEYVKTHFKKQSSPYGFQYLFTSLKGINQKASGFGGIFSIYTDNKIDEESILTIDILIEKIFDLFTARFYEEQNLKIKKYSVQSAIAAIMSRNMSHNIGSHILSTLGYEGISASDDRILFKYIQQRMDYIAQISTEIPKWTQSTWFLNDLMKRFFLQENILKYLGHSEGLTAYHYSRDTENTGTIEIKVNHKTGNNGGESENIIPGYNLNGDGINLKDFQIAIPGGVVGSHAFYTIFENIIRNAAKHDWRKADNIEINNLEITIEFENNPEKDHVPFAIYSNIPLSEKNEKELIVIGEDNGGILNASFQKSFIKDTGELKRENWGLGEMRISAGYLLKKDYGGIGFGGDDVLFKENGNSFSGIIKAAAIERGGKKFLGYRFAVPKPKEVLFIGTWDDLEEGVKSGALKYGIRFDRKIPSERDYNFIIFEGDLFANQFQWEKNGEPDELLIIKFLDQFPARIFVVWAENANSKLKGFIEASRILRRRIVSLAKAASKIWLKFDQENTDFEKLKISIYKRWIDHLAYLKEIKNLKIHVDLEGCGTDSGDEKEKIIFNYLVGNQMEKILMAAHDNTIAHANIGYEKIKDKLLEILFSFHLNDLKNKDELYDFFKVQLTEGIEIKEMKKIFPNEADIEKIKEYKNYFIDHLKPLFDSILEITREMVFKDEERIDTLPTSFRGQKSSNPDIKKITEDINQFPSGVGRKLNIEDADNEDDGDIIYKRHTPKYLGSSDKLYCEALSGSQSFFGILCTYLKEDKKEGQKILVQLTENALLQIIIIDERIRDFYLKRFKNSTDKFKSAKICIPRGVIYKDHDKYKIGFALQSEYMEIVETVGNNGKEKVEIKNEIKVKLNDDGIYFAENKPSLDGGENKSGIKKCDEKKPLKIDILIIHQGIIDKMGFANVEEREQFLNAIKKCIPLVIITSGRGDPMVPSTKFIPFSSIESFLMTDYPEKNLLVQSLMQIFKESK